MHTDVEFIRIRQSAVLDQAASPGDWKSTTGGRWPHQTTKADKSHPGLCPTESSSSGAPILPQTVRKQLSVWQQSGHFSIITKTHTRELKTWEQMIFRRPLTPWNLCFSFFGGIKYRFSVLGDWCAFSARSFQKEVLSVLSLYYKSSCCKSSRTASPVFYLSPCLSHWILLGFPCPAVLELWT